MVRLVKGLRKKKILKKRTAVERLKLLRAASVPFFLVAIIVGLHSIRELLNQQWGLGVRPRSFEHIYGIMIHIFQHADFLHLLYNIVPIFFLLSLIRYLFWHVSTRLWMLMWGIQGFLLWVIGRPDSHHIGASGLVYALVFFTFTTGLLMERRSMKALSLLTVFLYGGLIWGMIPLEGSSISWEGHLAGAISGIFVAMFYRRTLIRYYPEQKFHADEEQKQISSNTNKKVGYGKRLPYQGDYRDEG